MKNYLFGCFILFSILMLAQNPNRTFESIEKVDKFYKIKVNDGEYNIQFYDDEIVETSFIPIGESYAKSSHAVVLEPKNVKVDLQEAGQQIELKSEELIVKIQKNPFQISYFNQNEFIISEKLGFHKDSLDNIQFNLKNDEILYGGGARALGMNRRGHRLQLYNRAHYGYETHSELMNYTMPIVLSSKQYLLHFDNAPIGFLDLDSKNNNTLEYQTISGRKTYQVVVGDDWDDVMENYTALTGRQPMLPRWALGNFSSRFGYHSQNETVATIDEFKKQQVPVDAIILDLYWFGKEIKGTMGNLKFEKDSFPNPQKMIQDLRQRNVETILITEPFVLTTSNRWQEAVQNDVLAKDSLGKPFTYDFYFGNTGLIDIYSTKGYNWFKEIYKDLYKMNIGGIWGDLGEPEVHPSALLHATGTADEVHNIYGHDWARLVQDAAISTQKNNRPFILMRAAYSGSQRYGIVPWSGDVNRTWGGLQRQPEISLQMGMQGVGYMHSDLGGFAGANLDDELYARWLQYGVFQPIFRPHAQEDVASEPVFRSEKAKNLAKQAIELRYKLLPYNYNLMFKNFEDGKPLMRPLFFVEPENQDLYNYAETYLWGEDFLISPVLEAGKTMQEVYFPKGNDWIDYYSGKKYEGGKSQNVQLVEDHIPTFVRSGAIIPTAKPMQNTKEFDGNELVLNYYYNEQKSTELELYQDDGKLRNAYENGAYEILEIEAETEKNILKFELEAEIGKKYKSSQKTVELFIHNLTKTPKKVTIGENSYYVNWNQKAKILKLDFQWNTIAEKKILIEF